MQIPGPPDTLILFGLSYFCIILTAKKKQNKTRVMYSIFSRNKPYVRRQPMLSLVINLRGTSKIDASVLLAKKKKRSHPSLRPLVLNTD